MPVMPVVIVMIVMIVFHTAPLPNRERSPDGSIIPSCASRVRKAATPRSYPIQ